MKGSKNPAKQHLDLLTTCFSTWGMLGSCCWITVTLAAFAEMIQRSLSLFSLRLCVSFFCRESVREDQEESHAEPLRRFVLGCSAVGDFLFGSIVSKLFVSRVRGK